MFLSLVEHSKRASKHPLKKLLDRVRSQRNQWTEHEAAVDLPTVITDEIPEKDTTIDTGSLTSEEKSDELPVEFHKPTHNGRNCYFLKLAYLSHSRNKGLLLYYYFRTRNFGTANCSRYSAF